MPFRCETIMKIYSPSILNKRAGGGTPPGSWIIIGTTHYTQAVGWSEVYNPNRSIVFAVKWIYLLGHTVVRVAAHLIAIKSNRWMVETSEGTLNHLSVFQSGINGGKIRAGLVALLSLIQYGSMTDA